jgi:alanyl-tRNA synthetase
MLTGPDIRRKFLDFFIQKGHREVHSSSLVPANDPTLLFTNAGMNQFKDVFLGLEKRDYARATTSQKCVRAGGKHNDLENVGFTNRHHTFFEMLGNFSFGDYFKKDAIAYAWELITSPEWFGIDKAKLYVTIFRGENEVPRDAEAYDLWLGQSVPKDRIFEMGAKDNFWQMGDTGPCGPCSEIHYDMGVAASDQGHTDCKFGCECGRYVELWNLVFMQFDRDASGKLKPLPKPSIDTGAGLERIASVLQGVISNYETDLFTPLIKRAAELTRTSLKKELDKEVHTKSAASLRVIADHARATAFLIADGVVPSNEGRGYVLRKIMRRAMRHAWLLGQKQPVVISEMVILVQKMMTDVYPELTASGQVIRVVNEEERRFHHTMEVGLEKLEEIINAANALRRRSALEHVIEWSQATTNKAYADEISRVITISEPNLPAEDADAIQFLLAQLTALDQSSRNKLETQLRSALNVPTTVPGADAFKLYDTFGLPLDFIEDAVRDARLSFDHKGFDRAMTEQRERARASWKGGGQQSVKSIYQQIPPTVRSLAVLSWTEAHLLQQTLDVVLEMQKHGAITTSEKVELLKMIIGQAETGRNLNRLIKDVGRAIENDAARKMLVQALEFQIPTEELRSTTVAIIVNGASVEALSPGETAEVFLDRTPFYAESGGQVGDRGWLLDPTTNEIRAEVEDCYFPVQGVRAHRAVARSTIRVGDILMTRVDEERRAATMRNHTATHLLHAGLREVLGKHVKQAGSLVAPNHLRFDFSHFTGVEDEELQDIEDIINKEVLRNQKVESIADVPIDTAITEYGAMALFGEKYGDKVRVIRIGDFSTELCGGTHTGATGEIGLIKILKEGSVSSGVRRIEAVTGEGSLRHFREDHLLEQEARKWVATERKGLSPKIEEVDGSVKQFSLESHWRLRAALHEEFMAKDAEIKRLQKELDQARMKSASSSTANIGDKVKEVRGVKVLAHRVDNLERAQMRTLVDQLRDKLGSAVVVLGSASDGNVSLIVGVTKDLTSRIQAGKVIGPVAQKVGGKGGGRPDLAEAGGKDAAALDEALDAAYGVVESLLG